MKTTISCIIPALNEEENIVPLLCSVKNQKLEKDLALNEIIVVDNGSSDKTIELAKHLNAQVYVQPSLMIGGLRNFGAKKATGEISIFLDADNILTDDVICKLVKDLRVRDVGAVGRY